MIALSPDASIVRFLIVALTPPLTLIALAAVDVNVYPFPSNVIDLLITKISFNSTFLLNVTVSPSCAASIALCNDAYLVPSISATDSNTPYEPFSSSTKTKSSENKAEFIPFTAASVNVPPVTEPANAVGLDAPILVANSPPVTSRETVFSELATNTEDPSTPHGANSPPLISIDVFSANGCIQIWPSITPSLITNDPLLIRIERYDGVDIFPPSIVVNALFDPPC